MLIEIGLLDSDLRCWSSLVIGSGNAVVLDQTTLRKPLDDLIRL
jgi:hypothetical protein